MNRIVQSLPPKFRILAWPVMILLSLAIAGCHTNPNPTDPFRFPGSEPGGAGGDQALLDSALTNSSTSELRPGETITIEFSDLPPEYALPRLEVTIGEDGKVTLYQNLTLVAAGKTTTQLQEDIHAAYVPRYYKRLTVTVKGQDLVYFVGGEVRSPGRQFYYGRVTVMRAIDTASGFTEYANKRKIELIRSTGEHFVIDGKKAVKKPELDINVLPNDRIYVPRRGL